MTTNPTALLFIPANRADFVAKAPTRGADVIILDLEDAIASSAKTAARAALADHITALSAAGLSVWVRINSLDAGGEEDIAAASAAGAQTLMLPKCDSVATAQAACVLLPRSPARISLVALIEDARGLSQAQAIAALPQVSALAFGSEDFAASLGIEPALETLSVPAQMLVLAAAAEGIPAYGLPGSLAQFRDLDRFGAVAQRASALGFHGALGIHPAQIPVIKAAFTPSAERIAWAQAVVEANKAANGNQGGALAADGVMIDRPILERAHRILARVRPIAIAENG
jgi:citrate lyase subunit beta/citryl-CoA lyase